MFRSLYVFILLHLLDQVTQSPEEFVVENWILVDDSIAFFFYFNGSFLFVFLKRFYLVIFKTVCSVISRQLYLTRGGIIVTYLHIIHDTTFGRFFATLHSFFFCFLVSHIKLQKIAYLN